MCTGYVMVVGLENRRPFTGLVSSNLTLSANWKGPLLTVAAGRERLLPGRLAVGQPRRCRPSGWLGCRRGLLPRTTTRQFSRGVDYHLWVVKLNVVAAVRNEVMLACTVGGGNFLLQLRG
jgi:hypothetical protein